MACNRSARALDVAFAILEYPSPLVVRPGSAAHDQRPHFLFFGCA